MPTHQTELTSPSAVAPRRRRFRFSLRTLLVLMIVLAIPLGWIAKERRQSAREHETAESIKDAFEVSFYCGPFDSLELREQGKPQGFWPDLAKHLLGERIPWISSIRPELSNIEPLRRLSSLQLVSLSGTQVSDLRPIAELGHLRWLYLDGTQVSELSSLAGLSHLMHLDISYTQVSELRALGSLTTLERLRIHHTGVTDLTPLADLTNLRVLELHHTEVRDLTPLFSLNKLKELDLTGISVSIDQIAALRNALPNCKVFSRTHP